MVGFSALMLFLFHYDFDNIHLSHHLSNETKQNKNHSPFYFYYHIAAFPSLSKPMPLLISLCLLCFNVGPPLNYIAHSILHLKYLHDCMDKSNLLLPALRTLSTIKNVVNTHINLMCFENTPTLTQSISHCKLFISYLPTFTTLSLENMFNCCNLQEKFNFYHFYKATKFKYNCFKEYQNLK